MLSAHEVAALMVLHSRGACFGIDPKDLAALETRNLIELRRSMRGDSAAIITPKGERMMDAVAGKAG